MKPDDFRTYIEVESDNTFPKYVQMFYYCMLEILQQVPNLLVVLLTVV